MNKEILCPFNLFDLKQTIYICDSESQVSAGTTNMVNMADDMLKIGKAQGVNTYHLIGNTMMCHKIAESIKTKYSTEYGMNEEIEVKVN